jgi:hypothetical protein
MKSQRAKMFFMIFLISFGVVDAFGQEKPRIVTEFEAKLNGAIKKINDLKPAGGSNLKAQLKTGPLSLSGNIDLFVLGLAIARAKEVYVNAIEEARVDEQVGGSDQNAGSTSLVSKGSVPTILGFAVENGALKKDLNGTTVTFRGNPIGIIKALGDKGFVESYDDNSNSLKAFRRLSFALSFDTQRGTEPGVFTGEFNQLSSYSLRYELLNHRDTRHKLYRNDWAQLITNNGQAVLVGAARMSEYFDETAPDAVPELVKWFDSLLDAVVAAPTGEVGNVIKQEFAKLEDLPLPPALERLASKYAEDVSGFLEIRSNILKKALEGSIITIEYINTRKVMEPDLSTVNVIGETGLGTTDLTANASLTFLNKKIAGMDRLRDFQLSTQLDVPLSNPLKSGNFVLSISGKYQRMLENTMLANGMAATTKGNIGIFQMKLTIPVKGSGVKIPLSITFANRDELNKEKFVRGNFGITFDLDSLFSKFNP